jgi:hypothetical protein
LNSLVLLKLRNCWSVCSIERVWVSLTMTDQNAFAGMFGGRCSL